MDVITIGKEEGKEYQFREACFAIIELNNKFYITKKKDDYSFIGGGIEKDETPIECLKREAQEEAGIFIKDINEFVTIDSYWHTRDNRDMEYLAHFYVATIDDIMIEPTEEGCELIIINKDEIEGNFGLPYQIKALELYLSQK